MVNISEEDLEKYQEHIINNFLDHKFGIRRHELLFKLQGEYQYNHETLNFVIDRLLDNKFIEVEKNGLNRLHWLLFRAPRQRKNVTLPKPLFIPGFVKL